MTELSFAALPAAEQRALLDVLERSGFAVREVCVSKDVSGEALPDLATVSLRGWCRSYEITAGWTGALERDLLALGRNPAPRPGARCGMR